MAPRPPRPRARGSSPHVSSEVEHQGSPDQERARRQIAGKGSGAMASMVATAASSSMRCDEDDSTRTLCTRPGRAREAPRAPPASPPGPAGERPRGSGARFLEALAKRLEVRAVVMPAPVPAAPPPPPDAPEPEPGLPPDARGPPVSPACSSPVAVRTGRCHAAPWSRRLDSGLKRRSRRARGLGAPKAPSELLRSGGRGGLDLGPQARVAPLARRARAPRGVARKSRVWMGVGSLAGIGRGPHGGRRFRG